MAFFMLPTFNCHFSVTFFRWISAVYLLIFCYVPGLLMWQCGLLWQRGDQRGSGPCLRQAFFYYTACVFIATITVKISTRKTPAFLTHNEQRNSCNPPRAGFCLRHAFFYYTAGVSIASIAAKISTRTTPAFLTHNEQRTSCNPPRAGLKGGAITHQHSKR